MQLLQAGTVIYSDTDLAGLLSNTDIVISFTASCAGLQSQVNKIIPMAAKSGVKLFVPCEFGMDWDEITQREKEVGEQPLVKLRKEAVEECERLGMGCLKVLCGLIPENMLVELVMPGLSNTKPFPSADTTYFLEYTQRSTTSLHPRTVHLELETSRTKSQDSRRW